MKQNAIFYRVVVLAFVFIGFLLVSCDQEPLFWDIAHEYPPIEPRIKGAPSKIVKFGTNLYVTNGTVWEYTTSWNRIHSPHTTRDVAVANNTLYALGVDGQIYKLPTWETYNSDGRVESIFGAGSDLFACSLTGSPGSNYGYTITVNGITTINRKTGKLMGVVAKGSNIYLGTLGTGMFTYPGSGNDLTSVYGGDIIGMASDGTNVYAVTPGSVYNVEGLPVNEGGSFSGGIAIWTYKSSKLLLVGVRRSGDSFGYGYREINLNTPSGLQIPGSSDISSVPRSSQYISAIGKNVVNHFWVTDIAGDNAGRPIIFASTAKNGLWSYRDRGGNPQWNGED
ncbi:MAG: hypothetical protein FWG29_10105 [Treponema sp.]|nr:hypothetical protein [Treponema sp.]